jgi:hypothetical protein
MKTILINGEDRVINVYLETKIDPNGSFVLPYQHESSDKIAQIESIIAINTQTTGLTEAGQTNIPGASTLEDRQTIGLTETGQTNTTSTSTLENRQTSGLGDVGQNSTTNTLTVSTLPDSQTSRPGDVGQTSVVRGISTLEAIKAHFLPSPEKYFIEGVTDSKFSLLDLSYPKDVAFKQYQQVNEKQVILRDPSGVIVATPPPPNIRVGKRIEVSGTNVVGMILLESEARIEYVLYLDTPNPIFYVDNAAGNTIFKYMRDNSDETVRPGLNYYSDMVDEPKILSEVFIDRGTNNAFEPIRKLKNVKDLNELTKTGFGYYKINTRGYNFKDK